MENQVTLYKKVLVIDDTAVDRYIAQKTILKHYFAQEVIVKESAHGALDYLLNCATEDLPQLIFLDIRMPDIDGFGFLEEYEKFSDVIKATCIVMMLSTSLNPGDHERARNNKYVNRFLNKPLNKEKLIQLGLEQHRSENAA